METLRKNPGTEAGLKKVLVIEDDPNIRGIVARLLEGQGYLVLQAEDGNEGLEKVDQADVVLLGLFLPGTTGDELMRKIRNQGNYVPVVVMSAVPDHETAVKSCKSYGIVDFIEKPFKAQALSEKVKKAVTVAEDLRFVGKAADRLKGFIERQAKS